MNSSRISITLGISIVFSLLATTPAQAQTFTVLHTFTGGQDGKNPDAGLTLDQAENLYGTAIFGGYKEGHCDPVGCGTVFKLTRKNSQWVFAPLYSFQGGDDGTSPEATVTVGPDGTLFGTTTYGGSTNGGTVYDLRPSPKICTHALCPWAETVLYAFKDDCCSGDGIFPAAGVVLDGAGNLYGTTSLGGSRGGAGTVYELAPSGLGWTETILHGFGLPDGITPNAGVIFDKAGNLYGTTEQGGEYGEGTVYELTPSGDEWTETILHSFNGSDGDAIYAGLIFDQLGNLYGAAYSGGTDGAGTVFELTPSNGNWSISRLYAFSGGQANGPAASLTMDAAGNLYGTGSAGGAYGYGVVFELTPANGSWTYNDLHDFSGGSDGAYPYSSLVFDANGNLYGTTTYGGLAQGFSGFGVVFEITP